MAVYLKVPLPGMARSGSAALRGGCTQPPKPGTFTLRCEGPRLHGRLFESLGFCGT